MKTGLLGLLLCICFSTSAQISLYPELSVGQIRHLSRQGINAEAGIGVGLGKRIDVSIAYRIARMNLTDDTVEIDGISTFISYSVISMKHHKLSLGTGLFYGQYSRWKQGGVFEKMYLDYFWNIARIRYNYLTSNGIRVGAEYKLYGDDGDGSDYFGVNIGYTIYGNKGIID